MPGELLGSLDAMVDCLPRHTFDLIVDADIFSDAIPPELEHRRDTDLWEQLRVYVVPAAEEAFEEGRLVSGSQDRGVCLTPSGRGGRMDRLSGSE